MKFEVNARVGARFKLVAKKADGTVTRETPWFLNLVLDTGLERMTTDSYADRCCVGTGNSEPIPSQVALDAFKASTTTVQANSNGIVTTDTVYGWARRTWRFDKGVAAGNISEVGLGWGNANLWNRALIKDAAGNPTTITVLSDEYLDVISEIRCYPVDNVTNAFQLKDKVGAVISTHQCLVRPYLAGAAWPSGKIIAGNVGVLIFSSAIQSITAWPTGSSQSGGVPSNVIPSPKKIRAGMDLGLAVANMTHKTIYLSLQNSIFTGGYQFEMTPAISKNSTQVMSYTFEFTWDRYEAV